MIKASVKGLTAMNMPNRIYQRDDNLYSYGVINYVIKAYMEEIRKALMNGDRIQLKDVGVLIPKVFVPKGKYTFEYASE